MRTINTWRKTIALSLVLLITMTVLPAWPVVAQNPPAPVGIFIPVIINIYANANVTEQEARDAVAAANQILRQAAMTLRVVRVNNPPGAGNGDNGDGNFTRAERNAMRTFGGQELGRLPNQKGIKISFGSTPSVGSTTPGVSIHRDPTIIVKKRNTTGNTSQTIAHEIGHVMTLAGNYRISDLNGDGDYDDTNETANDSGHANNTAGNAGNGNIMAPSNRRTGTHLTPEQIREMRNRRYVNGKCSTQWDRAYPPTRDRAQYGAVTDDVVDYIGTSPIFDLHQVFLTSLHETDQTGGDTSTIEAQITVSGVLPTNEEISARYTLGFDTDADTTTGMAHGGLNGIDRLLYVDAQGNIEDSTFNVTGEIYNVSNGMTTALPTAPVAVTEHEVLDIDEPEVPAATSFLLDIPKSLLGLSAVEVPVVATAGTQGGTIYDTTHTQTDTFMFDTRRWEDDPELMTFGDGVPQPGQDYSFQVSGLKPNDPFNLYVNDTLVLSNTLDPSGGFTGEFVFPGDLSNDKIHFLTAQDSTGEFAYSITCPESLPPAPGVGGTIVPTNKLGLITPWLIAVALIVIASVSLAVWSRRRWIGNT